MRNEPLLHRIGARQHGLVLRGQLLAAGRTAREIDHALSSGRLVAVHPGVYRLSGAPITWNQMMLAATLATDGAASHRGAPPLWGVDLPGGVPPFEVSVDRPRCPRPRGVIVHRSLDLSPDQVVRRHGIPVTNPLRMLVDLGAVVGPDQVAIALESLTSRKIVTLAGARAFRENHPVGGFGFPESVGRVVAWGKAAGEGVVGLVGGGGDPAGRSWHRKPPSMWFCVPRTVGPRGGVYPVNAFLLRGFRRAGRRQDQSVGR